MQPIRSPSQLTLDISAAHLHLSRQSMDSGYASSMSSARLPADWMLSRMYENWKIADAAAQRLSADLRALEECEAQLREARKRRDEKEKKGCVCCALSRVRMEELTATYSPKAKHKLSLKPLLRKRSSPAFAASAEVQPSDPDAPGCSIEELEAHLAEVKSRVCMITRAPSTRQNLTDPYA